MIYDYRRYDVFQEIINLIGAETVLNEVTNYFSSDDFNDFVNSIISDYDLDDCVSSSEEDEKNMDYRHYTNWEEIIDIIGQDKVLEEVTNYFSSDDFNDFVDSLISDYDLENNLESLGYSTEDEDEDE